MLRSAFGNGYKLIDSCRFIHSVNRANLGYRLKVNHLADRLNIEMKALRGKQYTGKHENNGGSPFPYNIAEEIKNIPNSVDWRLQGAVSPVKGDYRIEIAANVDNQSSR